MPHGSADGKKRPPGGQGLSHSPADGGDYPWEVTLLPSVVNGWRTGSVQSPELHPAVRRPVVRTAVSPSGWGRPGSAPGGLRTLWLNPVQPMGSTSAMDDGLFRQMPLVSSSTTSLFAHHAVSIRVAHVLVGGVPAVYWRDPVSPGFRARDPAVAVAIVHG